MNASDFRAAPDDLTALRLLCESVYQPTDRRRDAIVRHDWSALPRVARAVEALPAPVSPAAVSEMAARLVGRAAEELAPHFPPTPGGITPLEVVQKHVLERQPWPSLEVELREEGRPLSRGTLIRRQHEFLPYLAEWAAFDPRAAKEAAAVANAAVAPAAASSRPVVRIPVTRPGIFMTLSIVVVVAVALSWMLAASPSGDFGASDTEAIAAVPMIPMSPMIPMIPMISMELVGRSIGGLRNGESLPPPFPPLPLPRLQGQRFVGMALEAEPGRPKILLAHQTIGDPAAQFCLWDPIAEVMIWEASFLPPPQQRLTHDGVGDEVLQESYWVSNLYHAGPEGDLGDHAALTLIQPYSPFFVVFVDLASGEVESSYVHPGHLYRGAVLDVDGDGHCELVLGGTDNVVHRPVVLALEFRRGVRAASTVSWNESGVEGALHRVFLPRWQEAEVSFSVARLGVIEMGEWSFNFHSRILTVGVGARNAPVFHARLGPHLLPDVTTPFVLFDKDKSTQRDLGLGPPPLEEWYEEIVEVMAFARAQEP